MRAAHWISSFRVTNEFTSYRLEQAQKTVQTDSLSKKTLLCRRSHPGQTARHTNQTFPELTTSELTTHSHCCRRPNRANPCYLNRTRHWLKNSCLSIYRDLIGQARLGYQGQSTHTWTAVCISPYVLLASPWRLPRQNGQYSNIVYWNER